MNYIISKDLILKSFPISYKFSENFFNYWGNTQAKYDIQIRVNKKLNFSKKTQTFND